MGPNSAPRPAEDEPIFRRAAPLLTPDLCRGCGGAHGGDAALTCVNFGWSVNGYADCKSTYHPGCYCVPADVWRTVLTKRSHARLGLAARTEDALTRKFICDVCGVRAQCGEASSGKPQKSCQDRWSI